jgi:hypothetical protein
MFEYSWFSCRSGDTAAAAHGMGAVGDAVEPYAYLPKELVRKTSVH